MISRLPLPMSAQRGYNHSYLTPRAYVFMTHVGLMADGETLG